MREISRVLEISRSTAMDLFRSHTLGFTVYAYLANIMIPLGSGHMYCHRLPHVSHAGEFFLAVIKGSERESADMRAILKRASASTFMCTVVGRRMYT